MTHRQTISYLTQRFREVGLRPDPRHGQNFLIDLNLLRILAEESDVGPQDVVLEVGTGTGSLTGILAQQAAAVVTVEIDAHLHQMASEELRGFDNIVFLQQDALRNKNNFHPRVLDAVREQLAAGENRHFKLAANLPYNVATPVLSNLLETDVVPENMTATIQKELAERIVARPRTKDYSALSIWMQSLAECRIVRELPPNVFWPRPKVTSAIIRIRPDPERRAAFPDLAFFHRFVRSLFFHRRKFLRSVLRSAFKGQLDKEQVDQVMADLQLSDNARAEEQDLEMIARLCESFRRLVSEVESTDSASS